MEGYNYTGMGNSTNKKDAQSNAARDFVNYLVRINEVKSEEVPAIGVSMAKHSDICFKVMLIQYVWRPRVIIFQCCFQIVF